MCHNKGNFIHFTVTMIPNTSVKVREQPTNVFTNDSQLHNIIIHIMQALPRHQISTFRKNLSKSMADNKL